MVPLLSDMRLAFTQEERLAAASYCTETEIQVPNPLTDANTFNSNVSSGVRKNIVSSNLTFCTMVCTWDTLVGPLARPPHVALGAVYHMGIPPWAPDHTRPKDGQLDQTQAPPNDRILSHSGREHNYRVRRKMKAKALQLTRPEWAPNGPTRPKGTPCGPCQPGPMRGP